MEANKVFGAGPKGGETDKLNIDSIIARLLEGESRSLQGDKSGLGVGSGARTSVRLPR